MLIANLKGKKDLFRYEKRGTLFNFYFVCLFVCNFEKARNSVGKGHSFTKFANLIVNAYLRCFHEYGVLFYV